MNPTQADFATPSSQQQHLSHSRVALGLCGQGFIHMQVWKMYNIIFYYFENNVIIHARD